MQVERSYLNRTLRGCLLYTSPAAGMIRYFGGNNLVLINRDETPADSMARLVIHGKVGETLGSVISVSYTHLHEA